MAIQRKKIQEDLGASHVPASEAQMDTVFPQGPRFQTFKMRKFSKLKIQEVVETISDKKNPEKLVEMPHKEELPLPQEQPAGWAEPMLDHHVMGDDPES